MLSLFLGSLAGVVAVMLLVIAARFVISWRVARNDTSHRGLFRFSDGARVRDVDPIVILTELERHDTFRFDLHPLRAQEGEDEAFLVIADAVRQAFRVPEFTEAGKPGLTVRECYELFRAFLFFADAQKKNSKPTPISAASMESMSNGSEPPTTSDTLDSGSTVAEEALSSL